MLYSLRVAAGLTYFILGSLFFTIVCLFNPFNPKLTALAAHGIGKGIIFIMGIKLDVEGGEKLGKEHPCVIISNHQHNLDVAILGSLIPYGTVTIGKNAIKKIPIFGQLYWLSGNIMIDRNNKKKAFASMDKAVNAIKNKNTSVWIMPEGTRSKGRGVLPFKKGSFHVAIKTGRPIQAICVSSFDKSFDLRKWRSGTIKIRVLDAISPAPYMESNDINGLTKYAHELVSRNVAELDASL